MCGERDTQLSVNRLYQTMFDPCIVEISLNCYGLASSYYFFLYMQSDFFLYYVMACILA